MSTRDDQARSEPSDEPKASVSNPFAAEANAESTDERPQFQLSKKRAAVMGTAFGLAFALLALICLLVAFALSSWS